MRKTEFQIEAVSGFSFANEAHSIPAAMIQNKLESIIGTSWLNLLPDMHSKDVAKIGTTSISNILAVAYFRPRTLSCVGARSDCLADIPITYYECINDLPQNAYDILILDELSSLGAVDTQCAFMETIAKATQSLRQDGKLFVALPDKTASLKYRYLIKKALANSRFKHAQFYICNPAVEQPVMITPCTHALSMQSFQINGMGDKVCTLLDRIKTHIKQAYFSAAGIYNPHRGIMIVCGSEREDVTHNENIRQIVGEALNRLNGQGMSDKFFLVFLFKGWKQFIFVYDRKMLNMQFVIKIGFKEITNKGRVNEEYGSLEFLNKYKQQLNENKIYIPAPLYFQSTAERDFAAQSAIAGVSASSLLEKLLRNNEREATLSVLSDLMCKQSVIQKICTQEMDKYAEFFPEEYFKDYINSNDKHGFNPQEWPFSVQHGDYTSVNLYKDLKNNAWGVIDWEFLASGYPPLFDLFSLITSVRFAGKAQLSSMDRKAFYYKSFIETYFDKNWFNRSLATLVDSYCAQSGIDQKHRYKYFMAWLLFQCNKYRLLYGYKPFQDLYERMFIYSLKNGKEFIFN